jgi:hypothetical protein
VSIIESGFRVRATAPTKRVYALGRPREPVAVARVRATDFDILA